MTGLSSLVKGTKPRTDDSPPKSIMKWKTRGSKRTILVSVVASVVTALIAVAVVISLYYGTNLCGGIRSPKAEKYFFAISDSPSTGKVEVNKEERVIIAETRTSDPKLDDTVTLQDFNMDLQAVKDLKRDRCYVFALDVTFEDALVVAEDNSTIPTVTKELEMKRGKEPIPPQLLHHVLGRHIGDFCSGVPTYWLTGNFESDLVREKRFKVKGTLRIGFIRITVEVELSVDEVARVTEAVCHNWCYKLAVGPES